MKKTFVVLLSVIILGICGCGLAGNAGFPESTGLTEKNGAAVESTELERIPETSAEEMAEEPEIKEEPEGVENEAEEPEGVENEAEESDEEKTDDTGVSDNETSEGSDPAADKEKNVEDKQVTETKTREGSAGIVKTEQETEPQTSPDVLENEITPEPEPEPRPVFTAYSPQNVVSLATAKTKAYGKVTLTDNLNSLLADGMITQEEYNEYYPYDGAGYYSVFVQTDLNAASTTSGRLLGSEDAIAQYIADMLGLESGPYFLIEYAGVYSTGSGDFYEFRCYRA